MAVDLAYFKVRPWLLLLEGLWDSQQREDVGEDLLDLQTMVHDESGGDVE